MAELKKVQVILYKNLSQPLYLLLKTNREYSIWQGVTGGVESFDNSLQEAALREVYEELGVKANEKQLLGSLYMFQFQTKRKGYEGMIAIEYCFGLQVDDDVQIKLSKEHSEYKWVSFEEALKLINFDEPKEFLKKLNKAIKGI